MLVYPGFTALDLIGPHAAFSPPLAGLKVHLVWKKIEPVTTDSGITLMPTMTLADCPEALEILFVPGGTDGTLAMMQDPEILEFLSSRGAKAKLVTSVCTGSLVLGAAGLLRGRKATSHWSVRHLLPILEATPVDARYVEDGGVITGGGVTSGLDFGLRIVAKLKGDDLAQGIQLVLEYAPDPPFQAGSPDTAPQATVDMMNELMAPFVNEATEVSKKAAASFPG
ncbi:DJ-1/PfpI family protein [Polyangium aurulentum]|nr:DJ-1/PfpI family protein [Polyangium aurulentum]